MCHDYIIIMLLWFFGVIVLDYVIKSNLCFGSLVFGVMDSHSCDRSLSSSQGYHITYIIYIIRYALNNIQFK